MDRVLKRQKLDAEGQANIVLLQDDAQQQMRPRQLFSSGYPGLIHMRKRKQPSHFVYNCVLEKWLNTQCLRL